MDAVTTFRLGTEDRAKLKQAIDAAIEACGGVTAAATHCRGDKSVLSRSRKHDDPMLPNIGDCISLDRASGKREILEAYAAELDCEVVPLSRRRRTLSLTRAAGLAVRESGEAMHAITEATADGVVSHTEAKLISREVVQAKDEWTKVEEGLPPILAQ